ncbi:MAG: AmpG family muropeptide MFS transporter [Alphaproteobacteria bacterium]|nr:AmpG family muropeptide MFS transporter [Alphaproteobacteria bacterium]
MQALNKLSQYSEHEGIKKYFDQRLLIILFMGFSSGLPLALTSSTLQVWQTRMQVDLATIGFFSLVGISYSLKFLWAPIIDQVKLPGFLGRLGQRKSWAIITQIMLMITISLLGSIDPKLNPELTALYAVLVAFFSASQDIVIDAYRIELLDEKQQGTGAAMTQYGYRLGMLASGAGALWLAQSVSWFAAYLVMAGLMAICMAITLFSPEPTKIRTTSTENSKYWYLLILGLLAVALCAVGIYFLTLSSMKSFFEVTEFSKIPTLKFLPSTIALILAALTPILIISLLPKTIGQTGKVADNYKILRDYFDQAIINPFSDIINRQGWKAILLFVLFYKLGDSMAGAMANAFYVKMGFTNIEIAEISKIYGLIATLVGVFLGGIMVTRYGIMMALLLGGIAQLLSNLMFSAQAYMGHDIYFLMATISIENLAGGMGSAAFVAYLSNLCNTTFTATQYALFSSLMAVGRTVLSSQSGIFAEQMGWIPYFIFTAIAALPGLIFLFWIMYRYPVEKIKLAKV